MRRASSRKRTRWARTASRSASRQIDTAKLVGWKSKVSSASSRTVSTRSRSSARCASCAARRASRRRTSSQIERDGERELVDFDQCIIAAGSEPAMLPGLPSDPRIIDSTGALELDVLPQRHARRRRRHHRPRDGDRVRRARREGVGRRAHEDADPGLRSRSREAAREADCCALRGHHARHARREDGSRARAASRCTSKAIRRRREPQTYGLVLVAVGRSANGRKIAREKAGVEVNERGLIQVDKQHAHERAAHLRDRRHRRPADARAQGESRRQSRGRGRGGR